MLAFGHVVGKLVSLVSIRPNIFLARLKNRWITSNTGNDRLPRTLGQTSIIVQDGLSIQELPSAVKRVGDLGELCTDRKKPGLSVVGKQSISTSNIKKRQFSLRRNDRNISSDMKDNYIKQPQRIDIETEEGTAVLFSPNVDTLKQAASDSNTESPPKSCSTAKRIYSFLEAKIVQEENSKLALEGLRKIVDLENSWRADYESRKFRRNRNVHTDVVNRDIVLKQLVQYVTRSQDSELIVEGLLILKKDRFSLPRNEYRDWMCDEAISRAVDGEFTLQQLTRIVQILSSYKHPRYYGSVDLLWASILSKQQDIDASSIVALFKILKHFSESRSMMQATLEKKLEGCWKQLTGSQIADILSCFHDSVSAKNCLAQASKWANTNLTHFNEKDLVNFVHSLNSKRYIDDTIEKSLENYFQKKSYGMKEPNLVAAIGTYLRNMQTRNPLVLAECSEYFIQHGTEIPPHLLSPILTSFGMLNLPPARPIEFWKAFVDVVTVKFTELRPNDLLDILLSCAYLEKYFIDFSSKIFTSHFLNRIRFRRSSSFAQHIQIKLQLLDTAMSLECEDYLGPRVPDQKIRKPLFPDRRVKKIVDATFESLAHVAGGEKRLSRNVVLSQLPLIDFYILDMVLHSPSTSSSIFNLSSSENKNQNVVVFVHLPEHYCRGTRKLIGPQIMKRRHIRKLGFRLATINHDDVKPLLNHSEKLLPYLSDCLQSAEDAL